MVNHDENLHKVILDHSINWTHIAAGRGWDGDSNNNNNKNPNKQTNPNKHKTPTAANDKMLAAFDRDGILHYLF